MSFITQKINEGVSIPELGLAPGTITTSTNTVGVNMANFARIRYNLMVGKGTDTVTMYLQQSAVKALSSPTPIAATTITITGIATIGQIGCVELKPEMMTAGQQYVFATVSGATSATPVAVFVEGVPSYAKPATQFNSAQVVTQISTP